MAATLIPTTQATGYDRFRCDHRCSTRRGEMEARESARRYLAGLIGAGEPDLTWDDTYRLQGHVHVGSSELIVIAGRDRQHGSVVLTSTDWDRIRHSAGQCAGALVTELAIVTPQRLAEVVGQPRRTDTIPAECESPDGMQETTRSLRARRA